MQNNKYIVCTLRALGIILALTYTAALCARAEAPSHSAIQPSRVKQIEAMLDPEPAGLGPSCNKRQWWSSATMLSRTAEVRRTAEALLKSDFPEWNDSTYLEYSRIGIRTNGERMMNARKAWLYPLVIAECVEYSGRYLPTIRNVIIELIRQPTWTWPAHDVSLRNFRDHNYDIDLFAADMAHELGQTLYLLGDKLPAALRLSLLNTLNDRVFTPMRKSISSEANAPLYNWWLNQGNNWNAVCLKGVVGAALATLSDRHDRAIFAAIGEEFIKNYSSGFTSDGYTTEGAGYWNYGFSHFVELREILMHSTSGRIDIFDDDKVLAMAMFGYRIEMLPNNIAAFGDSSPDLRLDDVTRAYVNEVLRLGFSQTLSTLPISTMPQPQDSAIFRAVLLALSDPAPPTHKSTTYSRREDGQLHFYFKSVGVLVSRPASGGKLGVTIKAGGNGNHSHNDIGSYTVGLGAEQPVGDVGAPQYSAKTFSKDRYSISSIGSWGHPVPVVDGQLQVEANKLSPKVIAINTSKTHDEIKIDMARAYNLTKIKRLTRTLVHNRGGKGQISITDMFEFATPGTFEVALTTLGSYKIINGKSVEFWRNTEHLHAKLDASAPWEIKAEKSTSEGLIFTRLGIRLLNPAVRGYIRVSYLPVASR